MQLSARIVLASYNVLYSSTQTEKVRSMTGSQSGVLHENVLIRNMLIGEES